MSGQTRNRDEAIERFKSGEVNVFLINLKTGGDKEESLKLTAEDLAAVCRPTLAFFSNAEGAQFANLV